MLARTGVSGWLFSDAPITAGDFWCAIPFMGNTQYCQDLVASEQASINPASPFAWAAVLVGIVVVMTVIRGR